MYIQTQHINWSLLFRVTHLRDVADVSLHLAQVLHLFVQELQHARGQHVHLVGHAGQTLRRVLLRVLQCLGSLPRLDVVPFAVVGRLVSVLVALGVWSMVKTLWQTPEYHCYGARGNYSGSVTRMSNSHA